MNYLKVAIYPIIILISFFIIKRDWIFNISGFSEKRIKLSSIFFVSFLIGVYSLSFNKTFWWGDVTYYNIFFSSGRSFPDSIGLNAIYFFLQLFTKNIDVLLFTIAFITTFSTLLAYRTYDEAYPISVLFLFLTPFFIETCQVNLKQAFACSLTTFFFYTSIKKKFFISFFLILLAYTFHVTAPIIMLISFGAIYAMKMKNEYLKILIFIFIVLVCIFFDRIFSFLFLFSFIPGIENKLVEYSSEGTNLAQSSTGIIALKGIPYYLITFIGFYERKRLLNCIKNYDELLCVSILASVSYFLSFYSYWMSRIIGYYWMTDMIFASIVISKITNKFDNFFMKSGIIFMLSVITFRQMFQMYKI